MDGKNIAFLAAGMFIGVSGVFITAKLLRPTVKEKLASVAARQILLYTQSQNIPVEIVGVNETFLKSRLLYPAIDEALNAAYI